LLTESSYLAAIYVYCGAAIAACLVLAWWLGRRLRSLWGIALLLLAAALLLTPAYPQPGVTTMAPALIVAGFELLLNGPDAARHALKPLGIACALALLLAVLLRMTVLRPSQRPAEQTAAAENDEQ
jgi:hypothetical protein